MGIGANAHSGQMSTRKNEHQGKRVFAANEHFGVGGGVGEVRRGTGKCVVMCEEVKKGVWKCVRMWG